MRNITLPKNLGFNVPEIVDITDQLPKNPAYTWASLVGQRKPEVLTDIAVHHSGVAKAKGFTAVNHANSHIRNKKYHEQGDPGIPYHFHIREGCIYQVNNLLDRVYGVGDHNGITVHICIEGNYVVDALSEMDRMCLYGAILAIKAALPSIKNIKGHNEFPNNRTECPAIDMNRVRADIAALEVRMRQEDGWEARLEQIEPLYNQINYMTSLIKQGQSNGDAQWALNQLLEVVAIMRSKKLLK